MRATAIALIVCLTVITALLVVVAAVVLSRYAQKQECRKADSAWLSSLDRKSVQQELANQRSSLSTQRANNAQQGYVLIALGEKYHQLAKISIEAIRRFDVTRPIQILCDKEIDFSSSCGADAPCNCVLYPREKVEQVWGRGCTKFESKGTIPKLAAMGLAMFPESMYVDVDAVPVRELDSLWDRCSRSGVPLVIAGRSDKNNCAPTSWHFGFIKSVSDKCGFAIPEINSGVVYFRPDRLASDFDDIVVPFYRNYKTYGIKEYFRGGLPDEIFLAIYMGVKGIRPADCDEWAVQKTIPWLLLPGHLRFPVKSKRGKQYYFYHFFAKNVNSMKKCSTRAATFWSRHPVDKYT